MQIMLLVRFWRRLFPLLVGVLLSFTSLSYADQVTFGWDANSESDLAGYKLYWGSASRQYEDSIDVGNVIEYTIEIPSGTYVAVTAYDTEGWESGYSDEVLYQTGLPGEIYPATDGSITYEELEQMAFGDTIQTKTGQCYPCTNVTLTFDSTAISGNLLILGYFTGDDTVPTAPTGYTLAVSKLDEGVGYKDAGAIYYKISDGSETAVTVGNAASEEHMAVFVEIEGPWAASPVDKTATSTAVTDDSGDSGTTAVTAQADEVAVANITMRVGTANYIDTWSNSFVERGEVHTDYKGHAVATKLLTATGAQSTIGTLDGSQRNMGMIATFMKSAVGDLSINISDTISVAESIGPAYDRWNLSASDTVAIAEAITAALTILDQEVSIADTISIVETLTVLFDRLNISASDTISVSELITIIKDVLPNISDTISVSEAITATLTILGPPVNVSDTVSVVEAITVLFTMLTPSISDAVSISETLTVFFDVLLPSISDTISIAESITVVLSALVTARHNRGLLLHVY